MQMRRALGTFGWSATLALALALATTGCPKNEAKVCSTTSTGVGPSCSADYNLCVGGTDHVECVPSTGGVTCSCIENGTKAKTFVSDDACNVSVDTLRKRAAAGCGWDILDDT
jgi:hypothetical protein